MTKSVVIVQARMGSTRLPGKVLMPLGGMTALAQCLRRCQSIDGIDQVVCAIPEGESDDPVAQEARRLGVTVVRGSSDDVLARYHKAGLAVGADWVMRVTSDCPLIEPSLCAQILRLAQRQSLDYACNNMPPSWPHGLDAEVFSFSVLDRAFHLAQTLFEREHVTPWIRNNREYQLGNVPNPRGDQSQLYRWTLDYPEDYALLATLFDVLPSSIVGIDTVLALLAHHPEWSDINAQHHGVRAVPQGDKT